MEKLVENNNHFPIGKIYFIYLFFVLFPQITGFSGKGSLLDTLWKAALIILTIIYVLWKNNFKIYKSIFIGIIFYFSGQVACIITDSQGNTSIKTVINVCVVCAMSYFFLSIRTLNTIYLMEQLEWFLKAFIYLMIYAVVYNLITNPSAVFGALSADNAYSNMFSSFFDNKQTFGMFLFMGIIASVWGIFLFNKKIYYLTGIVFFINLFLCLSRTALYSCLVFFVVLFVLFFRQNPKLLIIGCGVLIIGYLCIKNIEILNHFVFEVVLNTESTLNARTNIWKTAFSTLKGIHMLIGYGEGSVDNVLLLANSKGNNAHNGLVMVLLTGGILKAGLYIVLLVYTVNNILLVIKNNKTLGKLFFSSLTGIFAFSMGEALVFLDTSAPCIIASILVVAFPCCLSNSMKKKQ